jgi:hypothetical protein
MGDGWKLHQTFDIRTPRVDSLVWLDHPRGICMRRMLMRSIMGRGRTRSGLAEGCPDDALKQWRSDRECFLAYLIGRLLRAARYGSNLQLMRRRIVPHA